MDFAGKTAVITGGSTGIGKALAAGLAAQGMRVVIASTSSERLEAAAADLREGGAEVTTVVCDVADRDSVRALAARVEREFGGTDLLCANAGATTTGPYLDHGDGDWDWVMDTVLRGVTNCVQAFYPAMAARGSGQFLITGSQTGFAPGWLLNHGPYVVAKAAVHALAMALRPEAELHGVGVSLLVPAMTETEITQAGQRSRPGRYGAARPSADLGVVAGSATPLPDHPRSLTAAEVAERAIAGLKRNEAIIATHSGMKPIVEDYARQILAPYDSAVEFRSERVS